MWSRNNIQLILTIVKIAGIDGEIIDASISDWEGRRKI